MFGCLECSPRSHRMDAALERRIVLEYAKCLGSERSSSLPLNLCRVFHMRSTVSIPISLGTRSNESSCAHRNENFKVVELGETSGHKHHPLPGNRIAECTSSRVSCKLEANLDVSKASQKHHQKHNGEHIGRSVVRRSHSVFCGNTIPSSIFTRTLGSRT